MINKILSWGFLYFVYWYISAIIGNLVYNTFKTGYFGDAIRIFLPILLITINFFAIKKGIINVDFIKNNKFLKENKFLLISFVLILVNLPVAPFSAFLLAGLTGYDGEILYLIAYLIHLCIFSLPYTLNLKYKNEKPTKIQKILIVGLIILTSAMYLAFITL